MGDNSHNKTEWTEQEKWDCYNGLLLCPDVDRIRKILVRHHLFQLSLNVPGDVVELGVFKGAGLLTLLKFLLIHAPSSFKKVVGFDVFEDLEDLNLKGADKTHMDDLYKSSSFEGGRTMAEVQKMADALAPGRVKLVKGNVCITVHEYVKVNPGARFSLVYFDLDVAEPTKAALDALWDRIPKGGILVFDEYAVDRWTESVGVDEFLKDKNQTLQTLTWSNTPTAYLVKQ